MHLLEHSTLEKAEAKILSFGSRDSENEKHDVLRRQQYLSGSNIDHNIPPPSFGGESEYGVLHRQNIFSRGIVDHELPPPLSDEESEPSDISPLNGLPSNGSQSPEDMSRPDITLHERNSPYRDCTHLQRKGFRGSSMLDIPKRMDESNGTPRVAAIMALSISANTSRLMNCESLSYGAWQESATVDLETDYAEVDMFTAMDKSNWEHPLHSESAFLDENASRSIAPAQRSSLVIGDADITGKVISRKDSMNSYISKGISLTASAQRQRYLGSDSKNASQKVNATLNTSLNSSRGGKLASITCDSATEVSDLSDDDTQFMRLVTDDNDNVSIITNMSDLDSIRLSTDHMRKTTKSADDGSRKSNVTSTSGVLYIEDHEYGVAQMQLLKGVHDLTKTIDRKMCVSKTKHHQNNSSGRLSELKSNDEGEQACDSVGQSNVNESSGNYDTCKRMYEVLSDSSDSEDEFPWYQDAPLDKDTTEKVYERGFFAAENAKPLNLPEGNSSRDGDEYSWSKYATPLKSDTSAFGRLGHQTIGLKFQRIMQSQDKETKLALDKLRNHSRCVESLSTYGRFLDLLSGYRRGSNDQDLYVSEGVTHSGDEVTASLHKRATRCEEENTHASDLVHPLYSRTSSITRSSINSSNCYSSRRSSIEIFVGSNKSSGAERDWLSDDDEGYVGSKTQP